jgi:drug/metabolite transporter (DMT)-like permease
MTNVKLFFVCTAIWGSTWIAITFQLGTVAPEASVCYRFFLASILLFIYCWARGLTLRFTMREHAWMLLLGLFMFGVGYIFVYYAEQEVVSGLVAVGYSASPLLGMLGMWLFFRTPMTRRVTAGALLGIVGIALVFLPELTRLHNGGDPVLGGVYTAIAVILSALGSVVAYRNQQARVPLWQSMAWGMLYGSLSASIVTAAFGKPFGFEPTFAYVTSLLYLAVFGSILAFAGFFTLLGRIGAARAGYVGVMVPIVALVISAAFEGFRWHVLTWIGIAVSVLGNIVILHGRQVSSQLTPSGIPVGESGSHEAERGPKQLAQHPIGMQRE